MHVIEHAFITLLNKLLRDGVLNLFDLLFLNNDGFGIRLACRLVRDSGFALSAMPRYSCLVKHGRSQDSRCSLSVLLLSASFENLDEGLSPQAMFSVFAPEVELQVRDLFDRLLIVCFTTK